MIAGVLEAIITAGRSKSASDHPLRARHSSRSPLRSRSVTPSSRPTGCSTAACRPARPDIRAGGGVPSHAEYGTVALAGKHHHGAPAAPACAPQRRLAVAGAVRTGATGPSRPPSRPKRRQCRLPRDGDLGQARCRAIPARSGWWQYQRRMPRSLRSMQEKNGSRSQSSQATARDRRVSRPTRVPPRRNTRPTRRARRHAAAQQLGQLAYQVQPPWSISPNPNPGRPPRTARRHRRSAA